MNGWVDDAACRGKATSQWYPGRGDKAGTAAAVAVCSRCPVRHECLAEALAVETNETRHGIRGAMTAAERQRLTRGRR